MNKKVDGFLLVLMICLTITALLVVFYVAKKKRSNKNVHMKENISHQYNKD